MKTKVTILLSLLLFINASLSAQYVSQDENDRYIYDFRSRVSQDKMRNSKAKFAAAKTGMVILGVIADAALANGNDATTDKKPDEEQNQTITSAILSTPNDYAFFRIENKSTQSVEFDCIGEYPIDQEHTMSVRRIILPPKKKINLVLGYGVEFSLEKKDEIGMRNGVYLFNTAQYSKAIFDGQQVVFK